MHIHTASSRRLPPLSPTKIYVERQLEWPVSATISRNRDVPKRHRVQIFPYLMDVRSRLRLYRSSNNIGYNRPKLSKTRTETGTKRRRRRRRLLGQVIHRRITLTYSSLSIPHSTIVRIPPPPVNFQKSAAKARWTRFTPLSVMACSASSRRRSPPPLQATTANRSTGSRAAPSVSAAAGSAIWPISRAARP